MRLFTRKRCFSFLLLYSIFCLNFVQISAIIKEVIEFSQPLECKSDEYFDTISFSCLKCDVDRNLVPSVDRLQCICNKFSKISDFKNGHPICTSCGSNSTVTIDGKDCVRCKRNGSCQCAVNQIQIDRTLNGTLLDTMYCFSCPNDTYPSMDGSKCLQCESLEFNRNANCTCPVVTHTRLQKYCLRKDDLSDWLDVRSTYLIKFESQNIDSHYLRSELQTSMYFCKKKDRVACEHLSNICALTLYANGVPCMLFMQTHLTPIWLFYNKDETAQALNGKQISQRYSLVKDNNNSTLNFTVAVFALQGHLQYIGKASLPCDLMKYARFGVNFRKKCKLMVRDLLNIKMEFISPYISFLENEKILMHALPVLIKNINENTYETSHWQLVRKFFLVDRISGFKTLPDLSYDRFKKDGNLSVLRYMKSLDVRVSIQSGEGRGKIFPPLLIIEYSELTKDQITDEAEVDLEYKITFILKDSNIDYNLEIAIGILSGLALIFSGIKTWSYCKRNYTCAPSITVLFWFFIYSAGAMGNMIILSLISVCIYLFVFYKGQTVPYILLPNDSNEKNIRIGTAVAFSFKLVEMIGFIYQYWHVNVFFIDWEQPRKIQNRFEYDSPHTSFRKLYSNRFSEDEHRKSLRTPSEIIAAKRKKTPHKLHKSSSSPNRHSKSSTNDKCETDFSTICSISGASFPENDDHENTYNLPVGIWRTYFVANQWLKLQTKRKINIILQFIAVLTAFQIIQSYSWSASIPELISTDSSEGEKNFTLYYAVCTLVYILIYCFQWLVSIIFYERYFKNRMQEFIDLCSITNISVFILPFNYYGFYIHGRSVHGYADVDLSTLIKDLRREEKNLCAHRGLVPGTTEQTFILSLTEQFKRIFDEFSKQKTGMNKFLKTTRSPSESWDQVVDSRSKLRRFLCEFIDHCFKEEDYVIKEQHFSERLCDILFSNVKEKSVFYIDNNHSFDQILFYGNEWLLATFEITVFAFIIVLCEDCILACVITVLISIILMVLTEYNSKRNLSRKALLDKRFFM